MLYYSPLEQFQIVPVFSLFLPAKFIITNSAFFLTLTIIITVLYFLLTVSYCTFVPNRWQSVTEITYEFIQNMLYESLQ